MEKNIYASYMAQIQRYPLLTPEQEKKLSADIHNGDTSAKLKLVQSNLRLVVSIANKYVSDRIGVMDLIQEGNLGLLTAASKFHYSFNTRFSTYAYSWITQYILRFIQNKIPYITLPHRKEEMLRKIHMAKIDLMQQLQSEPTLREIASYMDVSESDISGALMHEYVYSSIDAEIDGTSNLTCADMIADPSPSPEQLCLKNLEAEDIRSLVETLPDRERQVIYYRFNFDNSRKPWTLRQISEMLGISAETVRQMELRALQFLRTAAVKVS
ncbi:sigma-70 family RNA polymerase sigma factor [Treponema brennaborense]|uniref:RNA polymerase sigma factor n=1 Tax=Treponema brennaborense (strain DSM 12168 / CIP 105900 / DD5/3) TaxID=906968 RepID=F4LM26_TREBD|nr:RNA polymerase sigma factor RpoD/SigA [Treponema brennaborense]AEE16705.1 RNA polymerase, sigma 70 subunit, RpoD subfamily [Treponema brennaborense DSM 12168]